MRRSPKPVELGESNLKWYLLWALVAIELLMSFSFLGYIHIPPISITFAYIPILVTGCLMGPMESTILGAVFGLASMWKASAPYVMEGDKIFSPVLSGSPIKSILLGLGARILFGLVTGLLFLAAKRARRYNMFWIGLVAFFGKTIHAIIVYGFMELFFPHLELGLKNAFYEFLDVENLAAIGITTFIVLLSWKFSHSSTCRQLQWQLRADQKIWALEKNLPLILE